MESRHRSRFAVIFAGLSAALVATTVSAQTPFDGRRSVEIVAKARACPAAHAVPIQVEDGNVRYAGAFNVATDGKVGSDGRLSVELTHGSDVLRATGTLADRTGSGRWSTATLQCEGTWTAQKG